MHGDGERVMLSELLANGRMVVADTDSGMHAHMPKGLSSYLHAAG